VPGRRFRYRTSSTTTGPPASAMGIVVLLYEASSWSGSERCVLVAHKVDAQSQDNDLPAYNHCRLCPRS